MTLDRKIADIEIKADFILAFENDLIKDYMRGKMDAIKSFASMMSFFDCELGATLDLPSDVTVKICEIMLDKLSRVFLDWKVDDIFQKRIDATPPILE
jgi:hypothetical protein